MPQPNQFTLISIAAPDPTATNARTRPETKPEDRAKTIAQMRAMASVLPEPGFLLACLILLQQEGWLNAAQVRYFRGAVIFGKTEWNTIPPEMTQKLMQAVRLERFWLLLDEVEQGQETQRCTPAEIVCAIQPYTLLAPLLPRYSEAVLWAFGEMVNQHPDLFGEATTSWNDLTPAEAVRSPDRDTLFEIGCKVRRSVINSVKSTPSKSDLPTEASEEVVVEPKPPEAIQFNLFDL